MKRTILLGSLLLSAGLTLTQVLNLNRDSSRISIEQLTPNREVIAYTYTDEDGNTQTEKTSTQSN
ncbi:MAG: hypothetical protein SWJ54_00540 [Cyanobacteriota bacterium]|nr:hypothetical protein [Cyanobacteriota bacterium]